jgi:ribosomal protein S18 acetylase RimI-like enzyme
VRPPGEPAIRPAKLADLREIARLWRDLVGYHEALGGQDFRLAPGADREWRTFLRGHIAKDDRICLVADAGGRIVAFLLGSVKERPGVFMERAYGHISDIYVDAEHRRRGVGKALVDEALRWFETRRVGRVRLQTDVRNLLGLDFWRSLGFETTSHTMDRLL